LLNDVGSPATCSGYDEYWREKGGWNAALMIGACGKEVKIGMHFLLG